MIGALSRRGRARRRRGAGGGADSYAAAVLADGPELYWRLGEESGAAAADQSGNERDGTYGGGATLGEAGAIGDGDTAVAFSGDAGGQCQADGYTGVLGTSERTVEFWINFSGDQGSTGLGDGVVLWWGTDSAGARYTVKVNGNGGQGNENAIRLEVSFGYVVFTTLVNDGEFHHVVIVLPGEDPDVTDARCWIDGEEDAVTGSSARAVNTVEDQNLVLGAQGPSVGSSMAATYDELAIYSKALSEARIQAHYEAAS